MKFNQNEKIEMPDTFFNRPARNFQFSMEKEVDYMLQRTASLLLTDMRTDRYSSPNQSVSIHSTNDPETSIIPFIPLLLSANILRLWESFKLDVINITAFILPLWFSDQKKIRPEQVDWSKTCESFAMGHGQYILRKTELSTNKDWILIENVIQEYYMHISLLNDFFKNHNSKFPPTFLQIVEKLKNLESEFDQILDDLSQISLQAPWKKSSHLKPIENAFLKIIHSKNTSINEAYRQYLDVSNNKFKLLNEHSFICERPLKWRFMYIELGTGLGVGKDLIVNPSTDPPRLFEMWCFFEFANMLSRIRGIHIAQRCFILPHQNQKIFSMTDTGHTFYNFSGEKQKTVPTLSPELPHFHSKVLKKTCVEWFMELNDGLRIVFDTKYKEWRPIDNLQVLGYMMDFDAQVGVIIFSRELKLKRYSQPTILSNRIIKIELNNEKKFIACSLTPSEEHKSENEQTLRHLVNNIF